MLLKRQTRRMSLEETFPRQRHVNGKAAWVGAVATDSTDEEIILVGGGTSTRSLPGREGIGRGILSRNCANGNSELRGIVL